MARRLYSLYRLYGKRWVRISNNAFPVKEARKYWAYKVSQSSFFVGEIYSVRRLPRWQRR